MSGHGSPVTLDLDPEASYRVRIYCQRQGRNEIAYEGMTRFSIVALPLDEDLGPRWCVRPNVMENLAVEAGERGHGHVFGYVSGECAMHIGRRYALYLLDRHDPRPPGSLPRRAKTSRSNSCTGTARFGPPRWLDTHEGEGTLGSPRVRRPGRSLRPLRTA